MESLRNKLLALAGKMRSHHAKPATPEGHQEFVNFATELEKIANDVSQVEATPSHAREAQRQSYSENDQRRRAG